MTSLKSKLRGNLFLSRGARRNSKNSLWLIYSHKSKSDITLSSNNECIYWACYLEVNPKVKKFKFGELVKSKYSWEEDWKSREYIVVETDSGDIELHKVVVDIPQGHTGWVEIKSGGTQETICLRLCRLADVRKMAQQAIRYMQVLAYLNPIKDEICEVESDLVALYVRTRAAGVIGELLDHLENHDAMRVLGVFAREFADGVVELDFDGKSFGRKTNWSLRSKHGN